MNAKFKWLKAGFGMKWRSMNYKERQELEAWMEYKMNILHDDMMDWRPSAPNPDSIMDVVEVIEDAVTGDLPDMLNPHAVDEEKPKSRGKK